jgi:hypothetical protein
VQEDFIRRTLWRVLRQFFAFEIDFLYFAWHNEGECTSRSDQEFLLAWESGGNMPEAFVKPFV